MMGIADYRTYNKAIREHLAEIGEPIAGYYSIHQIALLINYYDYLFTEPLEFEETAVMYSKHLQTVGFIKNLLQPSVNKAIQQ